MRNKIREKSWGICLGVIMSALGGQVLVANAPLPAPPPASAVTAEADAPKVGPKKGSKKRAQKGAKKRTTGEAALGQERKKGRRRSASGSAKAAQPAKSKKSKPEKPKSKKSKAAGKRKSRVVTRHISEAAAS